MIYATAILKLSPLVEWQVAFWRVGPAKFPDFTPQARQTAGEAKNASAAPAAPNSAARSLARGLLSPLARP